MSRHFALNSELTGAIAKRLPHAKNQPSAPGSFFNQFVTDIYILRAFKKFSSQICISNDSENRIFSICLLYSLGDLLPICILVYFTRTIVVVPTLYFCTSV